jgi:peptidoglycan/xylan/chitin deacetylase (PgdA/CDA1 family)
MSGTPPIRLQFDCDIVPSVRARMEYAFRVYAAVYGHRIVGDNSNEKARTVVYGGELSNNADQLDSLRIPARYQPILASRSIEKVTRCRYAGEEFFLFHGLDARTGRPDWLAEIFEWLSSGHERGIRARDGIGRIPEREMIFARHGVPSWKPHASCLMAWLENCLIGGDSQPALPRAPSPIPNVDHLVICSHDVDFYFTTRGSALHRLIKNLAIAVRLYKSQDYFLENCSMLVKLLKGGQIGDYLPETMRRLAEFDATSTFFVVPRRAHRRDPNYSLLEIAPALKDAVRRGYSVEIHGSYTSSIEARTLLLEAAELRNLLGKPPKGSRQHWLRFHSTDDLFRAVAEAELQFDSSTGFNDQVGFRSGASFAFPPYNFQQERAYDFLEIPVTLMDGGLLEESRRTRETPQFLADRVLGESRKRGWGGISILWHNPVEALPVPDRINRVFWNCAANKVYFRERWVSTDDFFTLCLRRYHEAGLLTKIQVPEVIDSNGAEMGANDAFGVPDPVSPNRHVAKRCRFDFPVHGSSNPLLYFT